MTIIAAIAIATSLFAARQAASRRAVRVRVVAKRRK